MSYYQFDRQDILRKAKQKCSKEKTSKYYLQNKEALKEKARDRYRNLPRVSKKKYQELIQYKKEALK